MDCAAKHSSTAKDTLQDRESGSNPKLLLAMWSSTEGGEKVRSPGEDCTWRRKEKGSARNRNIGRRPYAFPASDTQKNLVPSPGEGKKGAGTIRIEEENVGNQKRRRPDSGGEKPGLSPFLPVVQGEKGFQRLERVFLVFGKKKEGGRKNLKNKTGL